LLESRLSPSAVVADVALAAEVTTATSSPLAEIPDLPPTTPADPNLPPPVLPPTDPSLPPLPLPFPPIGPVVPN
jgi:hypothetical protein